MTGWILLIEPARNQRNENAQHAIRSTDERDPSAAPHPRYTPQDDKEKTRKEEVMVWHVVTIKILLRFNKNSR